MNRLIATLCHEPAVSGERIATTEIRPELSAVRIAIATYLLGQMMAVSTEKINGDAKELKVRAAFAYADLLLKG